MSARADGGPAFPLPWAPRNEKESVPPMPPAGMTLRDYFAAKAMLGFIAGGMSNTTVIEAICSLAKKKGMTSEQYMSAKAYEQADAMLEARNA